MRRTRRIAVSTAVTTGVLGVAGLAVAAVPNANTSKPAPKAVPAKQALADPGAAQRQALQQALAEMDSRTKALGADLSAAQRQLAAALANARKAARKAAAPVPQRQTAAPARPAAPRQVTYVHAPAPAPKVTKPPTHTTTGASGASGGSGDDGAGDGGGDGGSDD